MAQSRNITCLAGGGKSLLVRRLFSLATSASASLSLDYDVVPTAGVELQTLSIKRKPTITFREVGGQMLPVWGGYLNDCRELIYVIDMANPAQVNVCIDKFNPDLVGESLAPYHAVIGDTRLKQTRVLVVLNKIDLPFVLTRVEVDMSLHSQHLPMSVRERMTIIEASALEGTGVQEVLDWIHTIKQ